MEDNKAVGSVGGLELARFSERVVAFCLDAAPFALGFSLSFDLALPGRVTGGGYALYLALWTGLFLVYQAFFSSDGRVSLGKRLMGLKVVDLEVEPLGIGQALMRSVTYLVSSVLSLGFLWSLVSKSRQCWHDMVVGSVVVRVAHRGPRGLLLARAGAFACLMLLAAGYMWTNVWARRFYGIRAVVFAKMGLDEMAQLQRIHHLSTGRFAEDLFTLSKFSVQPRAFMEHMTLLYDLDYGVRFKVTKDGYTILARAKNPGRTMVRQSGS
ncbi:MAG: RDD family protein [Elusimicrobia bacterium]|nr:RDD family protein [Elusimicrobiota bacterium]